MESASGSNRDCLVTHTIPEEDMSVLGARADIVKSLIDRGLNREVLGCVTLILVLLSVVLEVEQAQARVVRRDKDFIALAHKAHT